MPVRETMAPILSGSPPSAASSSPQAAVITANETASETASAAVKTAIESFNVRPRMV